MSAASFARSAGKGPEWAKAKVFTSAAANFATDLEHETAATFAGEAMGGSPNLYGDAREIKLPYGGQSVYMATRYWERSTADDRRITIEPDIPAALSSDDYFSGRDTSNCCRVWC